MFSGQEPIAKISEDVNSSALPVFKSAHDTESCQENIKQNKTKKKRNGRAVVLGEVIDEQCHGNVFLLPYFFLN